MHRPGIASVSGDRIILDGTTVEEVERYHAETLRSVVAKVNDDAARIEERETARKEAEEAARGTHEATVREVANRVPFEE